MTTIYNMDGLQRAINQTRATIANVSQSAQRAMESTHNEHGELLVPAGQVRRIREKAIADYEQAAQRVKADLGDWEAQAHTYRVKAAGDPFAMLGNLERERANSLLPTARLYCESAPLAELAARLESVAASDDLPAQLVYRLCAGGRAAKDIPPAGPDATAQPSGESGRLEFVQALETLRAVAIPREAVEAAELAAAITEAVNALRIEVAGKAPSVQERAAQESERFYRRDF